MVITKRSAQGLLEESNADPTIPVGASKEATLLKPPAKKAKPTVNNVRTDSKKKTISIRPVGEITVLYGMDGIPKGWSFGHFFHGRNYLKKLSNRYRETTLIGPISFRPFSNLVTKWIPTTEHLGQNLWLIQIEGKNHEDDDDLDLFKTVPTATALAWARKIARAMLLHEIFDRIDVSEHHFTSEEEAEFDCFFAPNNEKNGSSVTTLYPPGEYEEEI